MSIINVDDIQYELINWSNPELHQELLRQFHSICCLEFNESEMEKLDVWEYLVRTQDPKWPYRMSLTIAYCYSQDQEHQEEVVENEKKDQEEKEKETVPKKKKILILGGVDHEYYPRSNCGMYPYVVVAKEARGLGLCSKLVSKGFEALNKIARSEPYNRENGIDELFIELSQKSEAKDDGNPYHSVEAAITRHKIWEKVGFLGLEFSFRHPAHLRNTAHQLTVFRPTTEEEDKEKKNKKPVAVKTIDCFFRDMFRGIMMQVNEEEKSDEEVDKVMSQVPKGKEFVEISEWW